MGKLHLGMIEPAVHDARQRESYLQFPVTITVSYIVFSVSSRLIGSGFEFSIL